MADAAHLLLSLDSPYIGHEPISRYPLTVPLANAIANRPKETVQEPSQRRSSCRRAFSWEPSRSSQPNEHIPIVDDPSKDVAIGRGRPDGDSSCPSTEIKETEKQLPAFEFAPWIEGLYFIQDASSRPTIEITDQEDSKKGYDKLSFVLQDEEKQWMVNVNKGAIENGYLTVGDLKNHVVRCLNIEEPSILRLFFADTPLLDVMVPVRSYGVVPFPLSQITIDYPDTLFLEDRRRDPDSTANLHAVRFKRDSINSGRTTVRHVLRAANKIYPVSEPATQKLRLLFNHQVLKDPDMSLRDMGITSLSEIECEIEYKRSTAWLINTTTSVRRQTAMMKNDHEAGDSCMVPNQTQRRKDIGKQIQDLTARVNDIMKEDIQEDDIQNQVPLYGELINEMLIQWDLLSVTERICSTCTVAKAASDFPEWITKNCSHVPNVCRVCMENWIASEVNRKVWGPIGCPECPYSVLKHHEVQKHADPDTFRRYDDLALRSAVNGMADFHWCLNTKCDSGQIVCSGATGFFQCLACGHKQCLRHNTEWHEHESCTQYDYRTKGLMGIMGKDDEERSEKWKRSVTRRCPKCAAPIEKSAGCNHMYCKACGHEFGWKKASRYRSPSKALLSKDVLRRIAESIVS